MGEIVDFPGSGDAVALRPQHLQKPIAEYTPEQALELQALYWTVMVRTFGAEQAEGLNGAFVTGMRKARSA